MLQRGRLIPTILILMLISGCAHLTSQYPFTTIGSIQQEPENFLGRQIRVSGMYEPAADLEKGEVNGILTQDHHSIAIKGTVFDWVPTARTTIQVWGKLIMEGDTPVLQFHNGRSLGSLFRRPRSLPTLNQGDSVTITGRLNIRDQTIVLITEELKTIEITGYTVPSDPPHLLEIQGTVQEVQPPDYAYKVQVEEVLDKVYIENLY